MKVFHMKNPVNLIFGSGSLEKLGQNLDGLGKKALIVTGMNSARKTGVLQKVVSILDNAGVKSVLFEKIMPNPLSTTINEGVKLAKDENCDFIIGIGGGSAIDASKAIALCAVNEGNITDYQPGNKYADRVPQKALPIVAITTTAGTGTEIDRYFVVTNIENNEKPGLGYACTYPAFSIVDPELMLTVSADVTADTGVDVLFHALEAYLSIGANLFTDIIAKEAISLVVDNLEKVLDDGSNINARTNMAWANTLAGLAIDYAGTVAIHGAGHPISGHFNAAHGKTLAALGVAYLRNNYHTNTGKFSTLAQLLRFNGENISREELASKSPEALKNFLKRVNSDITISSLGVTREDIPALVKAAFKTMEGAILNSPGKLSEKDIEKLYIDSL